MHYSTSPKSRFSRAEEEGKSQAYRVTFDTANVAAATNATPAPASPVAGPLSLETPLAPPPQPPHHTPTISLQCRGCEMERLSTTTTTGAGATRDIGANSAAATGDCADETGFLQMMPNAAPAATSGGLTPTVLPGTEAATAVDFKQHPPDNHRRVFAPLELLPPQRAKTEQVSLLSRPRINFTGGDKQPLSSAPSAASTEAVGAVSTMFQDIFVNPFNGRIVKVTTPLAKRLFRLGFYRSPVNPLHLEWSPTEYIAAVQNVMTEHQRGRENRKKRLLRQQRRVQRLVRAAELELNRAKRKRRNNGDELGTTSAQESAPAGEGGADVAVSAPAAALTTTSLNTSLDCTQKLLAACEPPTAAQAMAAAQAQLLRPLRRFGPQHWMSTLAQHMERQDVFTFLNKEMQRLYAELCAAYVPPKLDTPLDASVWDLDLTPDQKHVLQLALRGLNLYVGGSAGTGKTVLLKVIFRELTQLGLRVAVTATTGVAAVQLGGCTFHHAFNVPVAASPHHWDANALRAVDVVIVDEVSLLDANMFDAFDMEARLARMCHVPFGGLQVVVCGDFLQLSREDTMPAYESAAFRYLVAVRLVTPMRHSKDDPLLKLLEQLRRGEFNAEQFQALDRDIPASTAHITYIFPRRREAQQLNDAKLGELESREMVFTPQRGPLQLCGTFTRSALMEVGRDANGMQKPLPRREQLLEMIQTEARRICGGGENCRRKSGSDPMARIADHELVLMPVCSKVSTTTSAATQFIVRVRCRDAASSVVGAPVAPLTSVTTGVVGVSSAAAESPGLCGGATDPLNVTASAMETNGAAASTRGKQTGERKMHSIDLRRTHRVTPPFTETEWEKIASAVAVRLGGRLLAMLSPEPASLVPLSVSMTLADMTSPEIADSLSPLRLKLGCRVMVNRNLSRTVSNGSVGVVEAFAPPDPSLFPHNTGRARRNLFRRVSQSRQFDQLPIVRLLSGEVVQVPPVSLLVGGTARSYYYGHEVLTLPLQLGYAFTVHKVQGLTLQGTVVLDCEKFFDCPHLIYVACSRVRQLDQLIVRHVEPRMIIVRRSALEFSDSLLEASSVSTLLLPPTCVRGAWAQQATPRVFSISN
jgi:ATP-dependent DNA helicase PIF1